MVNEFDINNLKNHPDNRYFPRWQINNRVLFNVENDEEINEGSTNDMSCAGVCISIDRDVQINQKIKLNIQLSESVSVSLNGIVSWLKNEIDGKKKIGIQFYDTPEKIQDLILRYAFELDPHRISNLWFKGWEK